MLSLGRGVGHGGRDGAGEVPLVGRREEVVRRAPRDVDGERAPLRRAQGAPHLHVVAARQRRGERAAGQEQGDQTSLQRVFFSKQRPKETHPRFEFAPRDDRSSKNEPNRVEIDRDTRFRKVGQRLTLVLPRSPSATPTTSRTRCASAGAAATPRRPSATRGATASGRRCGPCSPWGGGAARRSCARRTTKRP